MWCGVAASLCFVILRTVCTSLNQTIQYFTASNKFFSIFSIVQQSVSILTITLFSPLPFFISCQQSYISMPSRPCINWWKLAWDCARCLHHSRRTLVYSWSFSSRSTLPCGRRYVDWGSCYLVLQSSSGRITSGRAIPVPTKC